MGAWGDREDGGITTNSEFPYRQGMPCLFELVLNLTSVRCDRVFRSARLWASIKFIFIHAD